MTRSTQSTHVDEMPGNSGRGRHGWTDQMRATAGALASLEIAIRGRRAAFAGFEAIVVHGEAHRTAGLAPLEACRGEDAVQAFALRLRLHQAGTRDDHGEFYVVSLAPAADHGRCRAQILDAGVG